jgi:hypothetical protein
MIRLHIEKVFASFFKKKRFLPLPACARKKPHQARALAVR